MTKKPWKPQEEEYLKQQYGSLDIKTLAGNLKRSQKSILEKARELGIPDPQRPFAGFEIVFIKQYYTQKTDRQLGRDLGRNPEQIAEKMAEIGLKRTGKMEAKLQRRTQQKINEMEVTATWVDTDSEKETEI